MSSTYKTIALAALAVALVAVFFAVENVRDALGSVTVGNEYNARQLTSADVGSSTVKTFGGAIGSVVIASTSPSTGSVNFYATSTTATSSADLIFSIPANMDEGTYTYDVSFGKGLLIDVTAGFNGDYVMTWR